tara:strand:- start:321 stop:764 length:444 start_codon:yes stop_codon:yes gene_type:complete
MIKVQKNDKPAEADIHLKYICHTCGAEHWISLKENQTPKYKIVCYSCDVIIMPRKVNKINFEFVKTNDGKKTKTKKTKTETQKVKETELDVVKRCAVTLVSYGFDEKESMALAQKAHLKYNTDDVSELVKKIIFDFGAINEPATTKV